MFGDVYRLGVWDTGGGVAPFVLCYLCSYVDENARRVLVWVTEAVLRRLCPALHRRAVEHAFSTLGDGDEMPNPPPSPSSECGWLALQQRVLGILDRIAA